MKFEDLKWETSALGRFARVRLRKLPYEVQVWRAKSDHGEFYNVFKCTKDQHVNGGDVLDEWRALNGELELQCLLYHLTGTTDAEA
jgi:hypothetical protein